MFLLGFGQKKMDTASCYNKQMIWNQISDTVKNEKKKINYQSLVSKIIDDFDKENIKSENLVFILRVNNRNPLDEEPQMYVCDIDKKILASNFNEEIFWSKKNIKSISNKLKKNLILSNQDLDFVKPIDKTKKVNKNNLYSNYFNYHNKYYVYLKEFFRKQKIGTYRKGEKEQQTIYYFPYDKENNVNLINDNSNDIRNFNTLELSFINLPNRIVKVSYMYNMNYENVVTKTYQYQNKNWVEIPTKQEH